MEDRFEPTDVVVTRDEGVTITYADGEIARFDLTSLRQACPCAGCRRLREQGREAWPQPSSPQPLRIEHAEYHGAWGLAITWNDGHSTGIFPFEALRRWADGREAFGPDSGLGA